MSTIKQDLQYTKTHEWIRDNGDGTYTLGITDYAQQSLGDIVFVELPEVNTKASSDQELCVIESVKAASGVNAPADLVILAINSNLENAPETINNNCYDSGFLFNFKCDDLSNLLSADEYQKLIES